MTKTDVLIMAAGSGSRFGEDTPKQFVELHGRPSVVWSVERFAALDNVGSIIVVTRPGGEGEVKRLIEDHRLKKVGAVVAGGETRQQSVWLGLQALDASSERVMIHDAARPCVTTGFIEEIIKTLAEVSAVVPVLPATDTLIRTENGEVHAIVDRVQIAQVQTPQGFHTRVVRRAHERALMTGFESSDDGSLVHALGEKVRTIAGERTNIKITYCEDVQVAESFMKVLRQVFKDGG